MGTFAVPDDNTPLEDGSIAYYDSSGNVLSIVDRNGKAWAPDTSVVNDFVRAATSSVSDLVKSAFAPRAPAASATVVQAPSVQQKQLQQLLVAGGLVIGGVLLFRAFK